MKTFALFILSVAVAFAQLGSVTVSPSSVHGNNFSLTVNVNDSNGGSDVLDTTILINNSLNYANSCTAEFIGPNEGLHVLYTWSSFDGSWAGSVTSAGQALNNNGGATGCIVTYGSVSYNGNTATYIYSVTLGSAFPSSGTIWVNAQSANYWDTTGWIAAGSFSAGSSPAVSFLNLTNPMMTSTMLQGDTWQVSITGGAPNQSVSVSGTTPGGSFGQTAQGNTDGSGNFILQKATPPTIAIGQWTETWYVGGVPCSPQVSFYIGVLAQSGVTSVGTQDNGYDDTTGNITPIPSPINPLPAMLTVKLPHRGGTVSFPSAAKVPLSKFSWNWKDEGGMTRYSYTLDNNRVWLFRVSDDGTAMNSASSRTATAPDGWASYGAAFGAFRPDAARSTEAAYSFLSPYRPGLVAVFFQNDNATQPILDHGADTQDNIAVADRASILADSTVRFAIGPSFPPEPTQAQIRAIVQHWVEDWKIESFRPFVESGKLEGIAPANDLEQQALDCLRAVLQ